jgi:lipid II:glycine glycyltransferase (peptidoglycan interpeptide bridge formation enzyme)
MGSNYRGYELGANALIWYSGIEQFHKEGYKTFNLGGVPEDSSKSGLIFFKTSLGAEKHLCSGGSTPHLNSPFFDLLTNMYRKMPDKKIKQIITRFITGGSG